MRFFTRKATGKITHLARANRWQVSVDESPNYVIADPAGQLPCEIYLYYQHGSPILIFQVGISQALPAPTLPVGLFAGLMARHALFGTFRTDLVGNSHLRFMLAYTALTAGVTEEVFGRICRIMARDVAELEAALRQQGLM